MTFRTLPGPRVWAFGLGILGVGAFAGCGDDIGDDGTTGGNGGKGGAEASTASSSSSASTGGEGGSGGSPITPPLVAESGYVEVPPAAVEGPDFSARMFYSFIPADKDPEHAPLMLFFNGGPGCATTSVLLPYGTGPYTLDADGDTDQAPQANPDSYTHFANLLYFDERQTGFSYGVGDPAKPPGCKEGSHYYVSDAGDYVFALLAFLDGHPGVRDNHVVVAGESYGGTRTPLMLYYLQNYAGPAAVPVQNLPDTPTYLPWLKDRVQAHFDLATPSQKGQVRTPTEVAKQFGWQVLIQGNFGGMEQINVGNQVMQNDPDFADYVAGNGDFDDYDIRQPSAYDTDLTLRAQNAMLDPDRLALFLGVQPIDIDGLKAKDRGQAFRHFDGYDQAQVKASESVLRAALGDLAEGDTYWLPQEIPCDAFLGDLATAEVFLQDLKISHTFMTDARYDAVVYSKGIPAFLAEAQLKTTIDTTLPSGAARPGVMHITGADYDVSVRFPPYEAGHEVTVAASKELGEDLQAWMTTEGAIPGR